MNASESLNDLFCLLRFCFSLLFSCFLSTVLFIVSVLYARFFLLSSTSSFPNFVPWTACERRPVAEQRPCTRYSDVCQCLNPHYVFVAGGVLFLGRHTNRDAGVLLARVSGTVRFQ